MGRFHKGDKGYIKHLKMLRIGLCISLLVCGFIILMVGQTNLIADKLKYVFVLAAVFCLLPACKEFVELVTIWGFKELPEDVYKSIDKAAESKKKLLVYYDNVMTSNMHVMNIQCIAMNEGAVLCLVKEKKDKKTEETVKHVQEYITEEMKKRMLEGSVSVYKEPEQFIKHIGRLVDAKPAADLKSFIHSTIM